MKTKQLGNSDLFITPIGFGAWGPGPSAARAGNSRGRKGRQNRAKRQNSNPALDAGGAEAGFRAIARWD